MSQERPNRSPSLGYQPALDGIRGVAVIAIMGLHAGVFFTGGGFYSLDTFFSLSGFLITTLLIVEWERRGRIALGTFWARRARRLLPGLFVMLAAVSILGDVLVRSGTYPSMKSDALASLFYFANWHFIAAGSNYFSQTGATSPLIHMWSLAVEEQFYLIWPLIFVGVMKVSRSLRTLLVVSVLGALGSALEMAVLYNGTNATRVYFGTDTHAQSILVGASTAIALALWARRRRGLETPADAAWRDAPGTSPREGRILMALGLGGAAATGALWATVKAGDIFAYRGGFLLASMAASAVLVSVVRLSSSPLARLLSLRPLTYVGRISYGLYLWHYPLFAYVDHARTGLEGWSLFGLRFVLTLAIATFSYYAIERPVRTGSLFAARRALVALPPAMAAVTATVLLTGSTSAVSALDTTAPALTVPATPIPATVPAAYATDPVRVLLVGDSQAVTLGWGLSTAISQHPSLYPMSLLDEGILGCGVTDGTTYTDDGQPGTPLGPPCTPDPADARCPPGGVFSENPQARCQSWTSAWRAWIEEFKPNVVVLLAGATEVYDRVFHGATTNILTPAFARYVAQGLATAVDIATSKGALMVLMTAPCYDHGEQPDGAPWPEDSPARVAKYNALVTKVAAEHPGTVYVQNLHAAICPDDAYAQSVHGVQIRQSDGVHFAIGTGIGGDYLAPALLPYWLELGHLQEQAHHGDSIPGRAQPASFAPA